MGKILVLLLVFLPHLSHAGLVGKVLTPGIVKNMRGDKVEVMIQGRKATIPRDAIQGSFKSGDAVLIRLSQKQFAEIFRISQNRDR